MPAVKMGLCAVATKSRPTWCVVKPCRSNMEATTTTRALDRNSAKFN
jgi:hypothetical protein